MHRFRPLALGAVAAAITLSAANADAASLTRAPYLQRVGPDTATIAFRLDSPCVPSVRYGTNGAASQTLASSDNGKVHAVVLTGLTPATEYTYEVEACGTGTAPKHFSTAPVPGTRRVHFAATGDFGTGGPEQKAVFTSMHAARPELFITLGDNAYSDGTEQEIQDNFFVPMADLLAEVPVYASLGNHEYNTDDGQPFVDNLYLPTSPTGGERYYSFDWGHVHFAALDSSCAIGLGDGKRCTLKDQKQWLEQDLSNSRADWKIVFFHHPPWSSGKHGSQLLMRREFTPIFERYGVDMVLSGHDHNYERTRLMKGNGEASDGLPYLVVGSGGKNLRTFKGSQPAWSVTRNDTDFGYLDVKVEEGTLDARMVTATGEVLDSFTLTKQLPPAPQPATLALTVEGERGVAPHQVLFRATPSLPGASVIWDFGDGQAAEGLEVPHLYTQPGTYSVTATATAGDQTVTSTTTVVVEQDDQTPTSPTPSEPSTGEPTPEPPTSPTPSEPSTGEPPAPVTGDPGLPPTLPEPPPGMDGLDPEAMGCSTGAMATLFPAGVLLLAGALRRRRR